MTADVLLSLCHFCEIHGPSVLFHSRSVDGSKFQEQQQQLASRLIHFNLATEADTEDDEQFDDEGDLFLFGDFDGVRSMSGVQCEGCSLHANTAQHDIVSFNVNQNRCFISEDFTSRSSLFKDQALETNSLRVTCLRSMSSELHPRNQCGVYFSTEQNEHVISFLFALQDSKSRGFQRKYSIFVQFHKDKHPFANFNFLIKNITVIISNLQKKAKAIYNAELKHGATLTNKRSIILDKVASAGKNLNYFEELFDRGSSNTSKNKIKARSLGEITGDSNIFYILHLQFASMLGEILRRDAEATRLDAANTLFDLTEVGSISNFFCNDYSKLRKLYALVGGGANFLRLASNVVVGNRVIVFDGDQKGRTKQVVEMLAKLLPRERIEIQSEAPDFDANCLSPNDSNLLGVCAKFPSGEVNRFLQDFYMCVEICSKVNGAEAPQDSNLEGELSAENCELKLHCCEEIAAVPVPTYVKKVEELVRLIVISDTTMGKRIDEMKFEWLNKARMFLQNAPKLTSAEVDTVKRVLDITDNDLQLMQFWSKAFLSK